MTRGMRFLLGVCVMTLPSAAGSQPPATGNGSGSTQAVPTRADLDRSTLDVLRDVHNRGAELYNRGDPAACYRIYEGALLAVRPFMAHRPAIQKVIEDGLTEVARTDGVKIQAFRLHEVIEDVRGRLKAELKLPESDKVPMKEKDAPTAPANVTGKITLDGKPVSGVEVTLVSLNDPSPKVISTRADESGAFTFQSSMKAGKYAVMVTSTKTGLVPVKYETTGTSGLVVEVSDPPKELAITLTSK